MNKPTFEPSKLIEKYKFYIGGGLLVIILALGGYLLWRENYWKPGQKDRISNQELRIGELEDRVSDLENQKAELTSNPATAQPVNESTNPPVANSGAVAGASTPASPTQAITGKININTANASELDSLPGIGPAYAGRIIDYRNANGGFKSINEIKNVKGIGDKTFEKFRDRITI